VSEHSAAIPDGRRPRGRYADAALLALALGASGCTQSALLGRETASAFDGGVYNDGWAYDLAPVDGLGYVDGALHAHAVIDYVKHVYWFGSDGDPSSLSLWIFQDGMSCDVLSSPGWIPKVRPTDLMNIIVGGTKAGVYPVVPERPPERGASYLLHIINQSDPVKESEGQTGVVVISSVKPGEMVSGSLDARFSTGTLQGQFNAVWCPTGVAP
jgi:hypothetical protein